MYRFVYDSIHPSLSIVTMSGLYDDAHYAGSLMQDNGRFFVGLGESIYWSEGYTLKEYVPTDCPVVHRYILSTRALVHIHDMVYTRYSSYHSVVPLFLGSSPKHIILYAPGSKKGQKSPIISATTQIMHIFPTLYSLHTYIQINRIDPLVLPSHICILSGTSTVVQRAKTFRGIKHGHITHIYATGSQIFWDWSGTIDITLHYPTSGYYIPHQDPRYRIHDVVAYIQKNYSTTRESVLQSV